MLEWRDSYTYTTITPSSYLNEVYTKYTTDEEKTHALADVYINLVADLNLHGNILSKPCIGRVNWHVYTPFSLSL